MKPREISHHTEVTDRCLFRVRRASDLKLVCSTNTYDGIRFESEFGHVKAAEIHFEKPLLSMYTIM